MTRTTCPYCGVGCGVAVAGGVPGGDESHPANFGALCIKGAALKDSLNLPDRLTTPMLHGRPASWDETLNYIAAEFLKIREQHGPQAIGFYVSGQLLTEDYYVANKLMKGFIGAANIDTNSRLCMASAVAGHVRAFGEDIVPGCYEDLEEADLVILAGSNMAWCHPVLYRRLLAAREKRGTRLVVIDPRRTATAEICDLHLALAPGADIALWCGLLAYLADHKREDTDWVARHVAGFEEAVAAARIAVPQPGFAAAAADLTGEQVRSFYELFARTERVVTLTSQGVNQSSSGTDKVNAIINCHLATGRIGRPGMGPFSLTGQPNAMGGREVGGLANQLAAHMGFGRSDVDRVRRFWNAPAIAAKAGHKAVDLFDAIGDGRLKAVWIAATNPADTMPRAGEVRESLRKCPLVIVADCWPTDTSKLAHVVLPAAGWAEKDGTVTNSERRISRQRAFRHAPGEARPDWWMFAEVARRMGWGDAFAYRGPADIFREHAALSAFENDGGRIFDLGGLATLDDEEYEALSPVQWPVPKRGAPSPRLFARGGFSTPDGRARMIAISPTPREEAAAYPLRLNTGRLRDQWHTMTRTGRVAGLMRHAPGPRLAIHPETAASQNISGGSLVRLESRHGALVMRVDVDPAQRPGELFAPIHWTDEFSSSGPIGALVHAVTDPVSGQPDLKGTPVRLAALPEKWRGSLYRLQGGDPGLGGNVWWSRAPAGPGFAFELAGWGPLSREIHSEALLRRLLTIPADAELVSFSDPRKAMFRYAGFQDTKLRACVFFASPEAGFPGNELVPALLDRELSLQQRLSLLSGVGAGDNASHIVCSCFGVTEAAICAARQNGAGTLAAIGGLLKAGTNCGSCIPELTSLLAGATLAAAS